VAATTRGRSAAWSSISDPNNDAGRSFPRAGVVRKSGLRGCHGRVTMTKDKRDVRLKKASFIFYVFAMYFSYHTYACIVGYSGVVWEVYKPML
jgi:hypothetical protein